MKKRSNLERLQVAGLIRKSARFTEADLKVLGKLSEAEVAALISATRTVGKRFLKKYVCQKKGSPVGIVF